MSSHLMIAGYAWLALLIASTAYQVLWVGLHFLHRAVMKRDTFLILLPDVLAGWVSINLYFLLLRTWQITGSANTWSCIAFAVLLNVQALVGMLRASHQNEKRLRWLLLGGVDFGLLLFLIQRWIVSS